MKESYDEGVATHIGPESCGAARKGGVEALTGERAGRVFEPRKTITPGRRRCKEKRKATSGAPISRGVHGVPRGQRPRARTEAPRAGTGRSQVRPGQQLPRDASGSLRTYADDERTWEVGQPCSTGEVAEQRRATGGGGDGGKRAGQREPAPAKRVPDTEPGRRAQCAGAGTSSSKKG